MNTTSFSRVLPERAETVFNLPESRKQKFEERIYKTPHLKRNLADLTNSSIQTLTTLNSLNISCEQIQGTLLTLLEKKRSSPTDKFPGFEHLSIKAASKAVAMTGYLCPFATSMQNPCHSGRHTYVVKNKRTNETCKISELGIGLLAHGVFEQGSDRVTPEKLCQILEIQPDDLVIRKNILKSVSTYGIEEADENGDEEIAKERAKEIFEIDSYTTVYTGLTFSDYDEARSHPSKKIKLESEKQYCHVFNRFIRSEPVRLPSIEELLNGASVPLGREITLEVSGSSERIRLGEYPSVSIFECEEDIRVTRERPKA